MTNLSTFWRFYVLGALAAAIIFLTLEIDHLSHKLRASGLHGDSLAVSLDVTRRVLVATDHNQLAFERRAYQSNLEVDALDKQLKEESAAREKLNLTIAGLEATISSTSGVTLDSDGARLAGFHIRQEPYTVDLKVKLPPPPDTGLATVSVTVDTAHVGVRMVCGKPVDGIRPASTVVTTPKWLNVVVDSAEQNTKVCNDVKPSKFWEHVKEALAAAAGLFVGLHL